MNQELDDLIVQLDKAGASDDEIKTVVNDYNVKMQPKMDTVSTGVKNLNSTLQKDFIPFSGTVEKSKQYATQSPEETIANVNERTTAWAQPSTMLGQGGKRDLVEPLKVIPNVGEDLWQIAKFAGNVLKDVGHTILNPIDTWNDPKSFEKSTLGSMAKSMIEDPTILYGSAGTELLAGTIGTVASVSEAKGFKNKAKAAFKGAENTIAGLTTSIINDPILSLPILSVFKRGSMTAPLKDLKSSPGDITDITTSAIDSTKTKFNSAKELFSHKGAEKILEEKVKNTDQLISSKKKHTDVSSELVSLRDTGTSNKQAMEIRKLAEENNIKDLISKDRGFTELEAQALRANKSDVTPEGLLETVKKLSDENFEGYKSGYSSVLDQRVVSTEPMIKALTELEKTARSTGNKPMYESIKRASEILKTKDAVVDAVKKFGTDETLVMKELIKRKDGSYEAFMEDPGFFLENPFTLDSIKGVRDTLKSSIRTNTDFDLKVFNDTVGKAVEDIIKGKLSEGEYSIYEKSQEKFKRSINDPILKAIEKGDEKNIVRIVEKNMESAKQLDRDLGTNIVEQFNDIKAREVIESSMNPEGTMSSDKLGKSLKKEVKNLSKEDFNYLTEIYQNLLENEKAKTSFDTLNKIVDESSETGTIDGKKLSAKLEKNKENLLPEDYSSLKEKADKLLAEENQIKGVEKNLKSLGEDSSKIYENLKKIDTEEGLAEAVMTTGKTPQQLGELMIESAIEKVDSEIAKDSPNFDIERVDQLVKEIEGIGGKSPESQKVVNALFEKDTFVKELKALSAEIKAYKNIDSSVLRRIVNGGLGVILVKFFPMTGMRLMSKAFVMNESVQNPAIGRARKTTTPKSKAKKAPPVPNIVKSGAATQDEE